MTFRGIIIPQDAGDAPLGIIGGRLAIAFFGDDGHPSQFGDLERKRKTGDTGPYNQKIYLRHFISGKKYHAFGYELNNIINPNFSRKTILKYYRIVW
jgi:hypothetical protein